MPLVMALIAITAFKYVSRPKQLDTVTQKKRFTISCAPFYYTEDLALDIPPLPGWGNYRWRITTGSDSAQFYFDQGINMYFAFHTIESIASFEKATRFDSTCAMAWYGRALALGPTINYGNGFRAPADAWQSAVKSRLYSANCTPLEKDLIESIQQRYSADTAASINTLRSLYADAMQKLDAKYSNNADVVTLYADALMLMHPWDLYDHELNPKPWTPGIQKILEHALALNPKHPGACHYYVHTMEGSEHPELALKAAETLGSLMPGVSHVTHMPSHIYIRTGYYKKGVDVNDSAVADFNNYVQLYSPVVNNAGLYSLHNTHLKATCAEMAANYADAMAAADALRLDIPAEFMATGDAMANYVQYVYETRILAQVRFGKWDDILADPVADTLAYAPVLQHFARGMAYSRKHMFDEAAKEFALLQKGRTNQALKADADPFSNAFDASAVAEYILQGTIAEDKGQLTEATAIFEKAVVAEDHLIYNEPRDWGLPARQYLGNALLKAKDYTQAITVFNRDLVVNPNNGWSLTGLALVYTAQGKKSDLKKIQARLMNAWQIKDVEVMRPVF